MNAQHPILFAQAAVFSNGPTRLATFPDPALVGAANFNLGEESPLRVAKRKPKLTKDAEEQHHRGRSSSFSVGSTPTSRSAPTLTSSELGTSRR